jgi:hypothetical protein
MSEKNLHIKQMGESTSVLKFCTLRSVSAFTAPTTPVFLRSVLLTYELLLYCSAGLVEKSLEGKLVQQQSFFHPDCKHFAYVSSSRKLWNTYQEAQKQEYIEIISSKIGRIINWRVLMNTVICHWFS